MVVTAIVGGVVALDHSLFNSLGGPNHTYFIFPVAIISLWLLISWEHESYHQIPLIYYK